MNPAIENITRISRVKKYIEKNISKNLTLNELASIANYSAFHFQRIFKSIVKETPKQYINRIRLESSSHQIVLRPAVSLLEIAIDNGFNSLVAFSRAFKNYYGLSPNSFRKKNHKEQIAVLQSKINNDNESIISASLYLPEQNNNDLIVKIIKWLPQKIIYTQTTLSSIETIQNAYKTVEKWAFARGLLRQHYQLFALMLDYPAYTPLNKCRFYPCVSVETKPEVSDNIYYQEIPSRTYANFKVIGGIDELIKTVSNFSTNWLPDSGFEVNHVPAIIVPQNNPITNHPHQISYEVFLAIKPK